MKPSILFVDDEPNVLDSLRLSLRPMRSRWDMSFVLGGTAALEFLETHRQEVVVSDMRMAGIDGAHLLREVQRLYPETVRIILSGFSDQQSVLKTVKLAHQYLTKPCRPVDLIQAVDRAMSLRDVLSCDKLKSLIAGLDSLPALPAVYANLVAALQDEDTSLKTVGDIIEQDVAVSASILRMVNSAFFGLPTRVSNIHHAVNLLGAQTIKVLVLSAHLFESFEHQASPPFSIKLLWEHSLRVAYNAKVVAAREGSPETVGDDSFIAGMLHDIGKLVLAMCARDRFRKVLDMVEAENCPLYEAERQVFGASHAEVGAYLIGLWGFMPPHVEAVCWHHSPERMTPRPFTPLLAVHAANIIDHDLVTIHPGYGKRTLSFSGEEWSGFAERIASIRHQLKTNEPRDTSHE
jgi:HD-like signal output (HDOD) protein